MIDWLPRLDQRLRKPPNRSTLSTHTHCKGPWRGDHPQLAACGCVDVPLEDDPRVESLVTPKHEAFAPVARHCHQHVHLAESILSLVGSSGFLHQCRKDHIEDCLWASSRTRGGRYDIRESELGRASRDASLSLSLSTASLLAPPVAHPAYEGHLLRGVASFPTLASDIVARRDCTCPSPPLSCVCVGITWLTITSSARSTARLTRRVLPARGR